MNTIEKVNDDHWIVNSEDIRYNYSFGNDGWYWDKGVPTIFPDTKNSFLEALEQVLNEAKTPKRAMSPGV